MNLTWEYDPVHGSGYQKLFDADLDKEETGGRNRPYGYIFMCKGYAKVCTDSISHPQFLWSGSVISNFECGMSGNKYRQAQQVLEQYVREQRKKT